MRGKKKKVRSAQSAGEITISQWRSSKTGITSEISKILAEDDLIK